MKENKQETELKLSKNQLQSMISSHIQEEQGLNDLFAMIMLSEGRAFVILVKNYMITIKFS